MSVAVQSGFPVHAAAAKSTFAGSVIAPIDVARSGHAGPQLEPAHLNRPPTFAEVAHRILLAKPIASAPGKAKTASPKAADSQPAVKANEPAANAGSGAADNFATPSTGLVAVPLAAVQPNALPQALAIAPEAASQVSTGLASAQPVSFPVSSQVSSPDIIPEQGLRALAATVSDTSKFLAARLPPVAITPGLSPALPPKADRLPSQLAVDPIFGTASGDALKLSAESSANLRQGEAGNAAAAGLPSSAVPAASSLQPFHFAGTDTAQAAPVSDSRRSNSSVAPSPQLVAALQTATVWKTRGTTPAAHKTLGAEVMTANLGNPHSAGVGPLNPEPQPSGVPDVQPVNLSPSLNLAGAEPADRAIPILAAVPGLPSAPAPAPQTAVSGTRSAIVPTPSPFGGNGKSARASTPGVGNTVPGGTLETSLPQDWGTATGTSNPIALPDSAATHKDFSGPAALSGQPDTRNVQGVLDSAPLAAVQGESAAEGIRAGTLGNILGAKNPGTSELRLHWKTDAFGRIDLHTVVSNNRVGVTLYSERGDLRGVLGAESARFDANLQRHDLHLRELLFTEGETSPSKNFSGGQNQAEARHGPPDRQATGSSAPPGNARNRTTESLRTAPTMQGGGLSVHV